MTTATEVLPEEDLEITENNGLRHFVRIRALMNVGPVVSLCGKKYYPKIVGAAVMDLDACEPCENLMSMLRLMYGE